MDLMSPPPGRRLRRAAVLIAVVGLVECLLFGCCATGLAVTDPSMADLGQSPVTLPPGMSQNQFLDFARGVLTVLAVLAVVLLVVPALALLAMTPLIDRGRPWAVTGARVILWAHIVLVAVAVLLNLVGSVLTLSLLSLLMTIVLLGGLLALQIWAIRSLGAAGTSPVESPDDDVFEPWNSHLA